MTTPAGPWTCPQCGHTNRAGSRFCSNCRTQNPALQAAATRRVPAAGAPPPAPPPFATPPPFAMPRQRAGCRGRAGGG